MILRLNGCEYETDDIQHGADSCDSFIVTAYNVTEDREATDDECNQLTDENQDAISEDWYEWQQGRAEYYADINEDR